MENNKGKQIVEAIRKARERKIRDDLILDEIKKQNPGKEVFFKKAEEGGATAVQILDEIVKQNSVEEKTSSKQFSPPTPPETTSVPALTNKPPKPLLSNLFTKLLEGRRVKIIALGLLGILGAAFVFAFIFFRTPLSADISEREMVNFNFSEAEIAAISEPSIVKIGYAVEGEVTVEPFSVDLVTYDVKKNPDGEPIVIPINDMYWEGTGFVISSEGVILTNAHVATKGLIEIGVMVVATDLVIGEKIFELIIEGEYEKVEELGKRAEEFFEDLNYEENIEKQRRNSEVILSGASFDVDIKRVVFNPTSRQERLTDLVEEGFQFEVLAAEKDWIYNQRDIALIKIDQNNLPALSLGDSESVGVGDSIYTFGFPMTSNIMDRLMKVNSKDFLMNANIIPNISVGGGYLSPSFTTGGVTSLKESPSKDFDFIELDAKGSPGSSGSPVLNDSGRVVGMVSVGTPQEIIGGDTFIRAVPVNLVKEMSWAYDDFSQGNYYKHFTRGIYFMHQKQCRNAIQEFEKVTENVNENFPIEESVEVFKRRCEDLIEIGSSVDTRWDEFITR